MLTFLTQIRPLITGINSIELTHLKDAIDLFQNEEYAEMAMPMLASARVLYCRSVVVFLFHMELKAYGQLAGKSVGRKNKKRTHL
jgi:hypothetical protein